MTAAIVGAGELGAALASVLAIRDRIREIRLIDGSGTVAAGKALDIQQAAPLHGSAARIIGSTNIEDAAGADVIVLADAHGAPSREWQGEQGLALLARIARANSGTPLVLAGAAHAWLVERAVAELGTPWTRIVGSAPVALDAAIRSLAAAEADTSPRTVTLAFTGRPPADVIVSWHAASIDGAPALSRLDSRAISRITKRLPFLWPPGPMALARAAALAIEGLAVGSHAPLGLFVAMPDENARPPAPGRTLIASVRLAPGRVADARLPALSVQERVALDNALAAAR